MRSRKTKGGLSIQHQAFVDEYLVDMNGAAAARRVGYSEKNCAKQAKTLLKRTDITVAVNVAIEQRARRIGLDQDDVLAELVPIVKADIADFVEWDDKTVTLKESAKLSPELTKMVAEVQQTQHGVRVKLHDKLGAIDKAMRHLGMFNEPIIPTGDHGRVEIQRIERIIVDPSRSHG